MMIGNRHWDGFCTREERQRGRRHVKDGHADEEADVGGACKVLRISFSTADPVIDVAEREREREIDRGHFTTQKTARGVLRVDGGDLLYVLL